MQSWNAISEYKHSCAICSGKLGALPRNITHMSICINNPNRVLCHKSNICTNLLMRIPDYICTNLGTNLCSKSHATLHNGMK